MSQNLSSAAVMIGVLRVNEVELIPVHHAAFQLQNHIIFNKIHCTILQIIVPKCCISTRAAKRYIVIHIGKKYIHIQRYNDVKSLDCDSACLGEEEKVIQ